MQIEPSLRLNNFARANVARRTRNGAADIGVIESGRKIERVREERIA